MFTLYSTMLVRVCMGYKVYVCINSDCTSVEAEYM